MLVSLLLVERARIEHVHGKSERSQTWNSARFRSAWRSRTSRLRRQFYEKLGFKVFAGDASQNWLILKNGDHVIGLFQGMFEKNILTFNPGWDQQRADARRLHRRPRAAAPAEGARRGAAAGGGRKHHRARQLRRRGPRWQPDPGRPACVSRSTQGAPERVRATAIAAVRRQIPQEGRQSSRWSWATRRWKFGFDYGVTDLNRFDTQGTTNSLHTRIQWVY